MAEKRCFVISPIGAEGSKVREHADTVLKFIIEPALKDFGITPVRSEQIPVPGRISEQMIREILEDDLCIALLTGYNPNVFYEVAVAQCASRPLILLLDKKQKLPFDLQDLRAVYYDLKPDSLFEGDYSRELVRQIRHVLSDEWRPFNPLQNVAGLSRIGLHPVLQRIIETARPQPLRSGLDAVYPLLKSPARRITLRTGNIQDVEGVDVLVNSENTDLQLARYYDPSISGTLRYLDSEKAPDGRVIRDTLNENLQKEIQRQGIVTPVQPGIVVATPTNRLQDQGAKYVFHVATVRGDIGLGYRPVEQIDLCVKNVFQRFRELAAEGLRSILFPVLGSGTAKQDPLESVRKLLPAFLEGMLRVPECQETSVLAWVESHRLAIRQVAAELGLRQES